VRQSQQLVIRAATIIEFNRGVEQNPIEEAIDQGIELLFFPLLSATQPVECSLFDFEQEFLLLITGELDDTF
jgi:hypothetical protein